MSEDAQAVETAQTEVQTTPTPTPKAKPKPSNVKVMLAGANSLNYDGVIYRKGEIIEVEASQAEQFMKSGLFERL